MSIKLSLCIPTYNRADTLPFTLQSIISQIVPEFQNIVEIVVSDNASTDSTQEVIREYQQLFSNITYFRFPSNQGPDTNFLQVISIARGEYCWYVGSDDSLMDNSLKLLMEELLSNPRDFYLLNKQGYDRQLILKMPIYNPLEGYPSTEVSNESPITFKLKALSMFGYIGVLCVRRDIWKSIDPIRFIGTAYVHVYVMQKIIHNGARGRYLSKYFIKWRYDNDSILTESKALGRLKIELNYIDITKEVFGDKSCEHRFIREEIARTNVLRLLLSYKLNRSFKMGMINLLLKKLKFSYVLYIQILPLCFTPKIALVVLRFIYRISFKKIKLDRFNESCSCS